MISPTSATCGLWGMRRPSRSYRSRSARGRGHLVLRFRMSRRFTDGDLYTAATCPGLRKPVPPVSQPGTHPACPAWPDRRRLTWDSLDQRDVRKQFCRSRAWRRQEGPSCIGSSPVGVRSPELPVPACAICFIQGRKYGLPEESILKCQSQP